MRSTTDPQRSLDDTPTARPDQARAIITVLFALLALGPTTQLLAQNRLSQEALSLRNLGFAQLENEKNAEAEKTYRRLVKVVPRDPLSHANLAVALLRQQQNNAALQSIDKALELVPGRADLLAIKADVLAWSGGNDEALELYRLAFDADPNNPELVYALYRHATTLRGNSADAQKAADEALLQMARLRPDNLVVLLESGQRAIEQGDRAAATQAYLRIRELVWALEQRNRQLAERVLPKIFSALEINELAKARVPSLQLGNVLRASGRYKSSLVELYDGIQGIPVERFVDEPSPRTFGEGLDITFSGTNLSSAPGTGALSVADWNDDGRADVAWGRSGDVMEIRNSGADTITMKANPNRLVVADLDNDVQLDLVVLEEEATLTAPGSAGSFTQPAAEQLTGLPTAAHLSFFDFDSDGDLDVVSVASNPDTDNRPVGERTFRLQLHRNNGNGSLEAVGSEAFGGSQASRPGTFDPTNLSGVTDLLTADIDRDGDTDILVLTEDGVTWLDNLRQGSFRDRTRTAGLARAPGAAAAALADLDNDGRVDLLLAGTGEDKHGAMVYGSRRGTLRPGPSLSTEGSITDAALFDADNDGLPDIALATSEGVELLMRRGSDYQALPSFEQAGTDLQHLDAIAADDADGDGDLDLFATGPSGLMLYTNQGGNKNGWMRVSLRGLTTGNDKNNAFGIGASIEVMVGGARQYHEAKTPTTHIGLGSQKKPDLLRVVWANGVPQNRIRPTPRQRVVEEQVLKGSCPFLYTHTQDGIIEFVTDLLWGAPVGMPVAEGVYAEADPWELIVAQGAAPNANGEYDLRITEELWEAAYFDQTRLWVVDHPKGTEATGSLRVLPGPAPPPEQWPDRVLLAADLRPVTAWDGQGNNVTTRIRSRDNVYADGYELGAYQGISKPWTFTFDLGAAPAAPVRLVLDGWIFPSDASINIAASQRNDLDFTFTRLEVETAQGWQSLLDPMGFPAGKTKTTIVDTPPLPKGASKLRIVTSRWLHWDRIAWTTSMPDQQARVVARLDPSSAVLRYRGFSELVRQAPNAPHEYDYDRLQSGSPWIPLPGRYTRYGDVVDALRNIDGNLVVMSAGDELALRFDASTLPAVAEGFRRTIFLESYGWDKDADRNTQDADRSWPLPSGTVQNGGQASEKLLTRVVTIDSK